MNEKVHNIIVIVLFRNVRNYILDCVNSILNQNYPRYKIYLLDDCSDDGTLDEIEEELPMLIKIRQGKRLGAMENLYKGLTSLSIDDDDIVVVVDGDDTLHGEYVFQMLNATYNDENILITYGQCITNYGFVKTFEPYTHDDFKNIRGAHWNTPHLRTFKYTLFKKFLELDPEASHFKHTDGSFLKSATDMALLFPLLEIAGYNRSYCFRNVLYCYRIHANNNHATPAGRNFQMEAEYCVRQKASILLKT